MDLVVLAGFMRILRGDFLRVLPIGSSIFIPPSFPLFPDWKLGNRPWITGLSSPASPCISLDQGIDTGPIIAQETVPVLPGDTPETLHDRIQKVERKLYPAVIAALARGEIRAQGRQTVWKPK